jgi:hypothetical protein
MVKFMRIHAAAGAIAASLAAIALNQGRPTYETRVYYYPFGECAVTPIGTHEIEESFDITSLVDRKDAELLDTLKMRGGPGRLLPGWVRLKIVRPHGPAILVDDSGVVKWGRAEYRLSERGFSQLEVLLYSWIPHPLVPRTPQERKASEKKR